MAYSRARLRGWQAALWLALGILAACYNPSIVDGGLHCHPTGTQCPDDYRCGADGTCHRDNGTATGGAGATGGKGGSGGGMGGMGGAGTGGMCVMAATFKPNCTSTAPSGTCDLNCQTGCPCNQKCVKQDDGSSSCQPMKGMLAVRDACDSFVSADRKKTDNCAPGLVCLSDGSNGRCFNYCASSSDCTDSVCDERFVLGTQGAARVSVCGGSLSVGCDPMAVSSACNACVVVEPLSGIHRTACEFFVGEVLPGRSCLSSADCTSGSGVGFYCPESGTVNLHVCSGLCLIDAQNGTLGGCPGLQRCNPIDDKYGFCSG